MTALMQRREALAAELAQLDKIRFLEGSALHLAAREHQLSIELAAELARLTNVVSLPEHNGRWLATVYREEMIGVLRRIALRLQTQATVASEQMELPLPAEKQHASDCAQHNMPAQEADACDCGACDPTPVKDVHRDACPDCGAFGADRHETWCKGVIPRRPDQGAVSYDPDNYSHALFNGA